MAHRPAHRSIGLLLATTLLASAAAQGLLLYRCSEGMVGLSCCCPGKQRAPAGQPAQVKAAKAGCCDTVAVPPVETRCGPPEAKAAPGPGWSIAIPAAPVLPLAAVALRRLAGRGSGPPPRPSPVAQTCSRLI